MESKFAQLNLDGAVISEFKVVPSLKIAMTLLRGPEKQNERIVQTQHDLQFNGVKDFKIDLQSEPWIQILAHAAFSSSEYLSASLADTNSNSRGETYYHFEITCGQGTIHIIATGVTFQQFNEIPYKESSSDNE